MRYSHFACLAAHRFVLRKRTALLRLHQLRVLDVLDVCTQVAGVNYFHALLVSSDAALSLRRLVLLLVLTLLSALVHLQLSATGICSY